MGRLHSITVGQQVGDEVATQQPCDFTTHAVVIDGHLRIAIVVVGGGGAVDVGVHAFGVLIIDGTVAVAEAELVAVAAQPRALVLGDEETGTHPRAIMTVTVHGGHTPEIHVADFQGVGTGHVENAVRGREIVVNTGVHSHLTQSEILVFCKFKHDVVARRGSGPVQRRLGVSGKVVTGLVPNGEAVCRSGQGDRSRRCSAAPFVGDGERWEVAGLSGFSRVEDNAFAVGVRFKFATDGEHHVQRCVVSCIEVVLHRVVKVKGEGVTGLISIGKSDGGGSVRPSTIVPLEATGFHNVPGDFVLNPKARLFHTVQRNNRIAAVG